MDSIKIEYVALEEPQGGDLVVFAGDDLAVTPLAAERFGTINDLLRRAAPGERFKGKAASTLVVPVPEGIPGVNRLVVVGIGAPADRANQDWRKIGGVIAGKALGRNALVVADLPGIEQPAEAVAEMALGARLRAYKFDRYKTKKKEDSEPEGATRLTFAVAELAACRRADRRRAGLADGVNLARDLVNEPPNVLFPAEFARRAQALEKLGVEVEILEEEDLRRIGMRALLAVGQGSGHGSRVAIMRWNGGQADGAPLAFIGKGVCFDSGGISIKPSGGMEDMKGDMAGAAAVVGLMHALASRKAKANVVGAIGLTENMPDGDAQRPGDIIRTLSGQTVEMVNSDAEGRLVLADVLWYVQERFKPAFMIDLATLTGAILVALAQEHAGLFSNNDDLADRLLASGKATGEKVWRMPLAPEYDKLIDSRFADMKNTGGRHGGSITAAQFLQRYVQDTPWAHLDIAGTGMNAPQTETNKSWGPGWGVRLLDHLVREFYER
ncbi:leucyl aminopeptidase [Enterovirga aerilata]|uniref:Probable cytosol aminopeptidase n=1 Tax=Enterovirga aerilata TaxID=2730920 RepID=A0A849I4I3_9HYPH|nr:leucyl aminopeptidase [Enterovirga sp. DB1703]